MEQSGRHPTTGMLKSLSFLLCSECEEDSIFVSNLILQLEKLMAKNYFLHLSAKEAYKSYVRAYDSHQLKNIFDVETLDLAKVAKSFGFTVPPAVDLKVNSQNSNRPRKRLGGGGYGYFKEMNQDKSKKQFYKPVNRQQKQSKW